MLSSLFSNLASDSPARIRLLAKFVEANYEKVDKLLEIRDTAQNLLRTVDADINKEKKVLSIQSRRIVISEHLEQELEKEGEDISEEEDTWYLRRLNGGLFVLQTVDYILAWITMEDDGVSCKFSQLLLLRTSKTIRFEHTYCKCSPEGISLWRISYGHYRRITTTLMRMNNNSPTS